MWTNNPKDYITLEETFCLLDTYLGLEDSYFISLVSDSWYPLLYRLITLLSLLPFSVSRVKQRDTSETICRKGHKSLGKIWSGTFVSPKNVFKDLVRIRFLSNRLSYRPLLLRSVRLTGSSYYSPQTVPNRPVTRQGSEPRDPRSLPLLCFSRYWLFIHPW